MMGSGGAAAAPLPPSEAARQMIAPRHSELPTVLPSGPAVAEPDRMQVHTPPEPEAPAKLASHERHIHHVGNPAWASGGRTAAQDTLKEKAEKSV